MLALGLFSCSSNDEEIDSQKPTITDEGIVAMPENCQVYHLGDIIPVRYVLKDNVGLGSYNIEIHNNFDHHSHSTEAGECPLDEKKEAAANVWKYNKDFKIPVGTLTYIIGQDIQIPANVQPGDYHFMIRTTDITGYQELKSISIKLIQ